MYYVSSRKTDSLPYSGKTVEVTLNRSPGKKDDGKVFVTIPSGIGKDATFKPPVDNSKNKKK